MTKKELIKLINELPTFEECMSLSEEMLGERNYAYAFGYLGQAVINLKEKIKK